MTIDPLLKATAQRAVDAVMREVKSAKAVLVSTEDGFEIASAVENTAQISRLSAMASSLSALGDMAGEESQLGACQNVLVQAADGVIAILQVRRTGLSMSFSVIAGKDAVVGQVLYFCKEAVRALEAA